MSDAQERDPWKVLRGSMCLLPLHYAFMYSALIEAAGDHGYALAIHGSMTRDCDLIAVPWIDDASDPMVLVEALVEVCNGALLMGGRPNSEGGFDPVDGRDPIAKPHGRMGWTIHLGGGPWIDLSVMPRVEEATA